MDRATPEIRDLARQLLAHEAAADNASETTALFRICEKLRRSLSTLAGVGGFRMLLLRALMLTTAEMPCFAGLKVNAYGSLEGLDQVEQHLDAPNAEAGALLIAQLLGLLFTFIGEGLTLCLVQDVWPEASIDASGAIDNAAPSDYGTIDYGKDNKA